jgi:hypothetical protein
MPAKPAAICPQKLRPAADPRAHKDFTCSLQSLFMRLEFLLARSPAFLPMSH